MTVYEGEPRVEFLISSNGNDHRLIRDRASLMTHLRLLTSNDALAARHDVSMRSHGICLGTVLVAKLSELLTEQVAQMSDDEFHMAVLHIMRAGE